MTTDPGWPDRRSCWPTGSVVPRTTAGDRADPRPGRLHGDHLHRPRVRRSGGLIHLDHPDYEGADARRIVDLAAGRAEVARTGRPGDRVRRRLVRRRGRVAGRGAGPAGGRHRAGVHLAPARPGAVPAVPGGRRRHLTGRRTPGDRGGVFKQRWASLLFSGAGGRAGAPGGDPLCGRFTAELCRGYRSAAETGRPSPALTALLAESGPQPVLAEVTAPTLIIAGEDDTLFPLDQADANLRGLPAATPADNWVAGGHDGELSVTPCRGPAGLVRPLSAGRRLGADTSFSVLVPETSLVGAGGVREPETLAAPAYPGRGVDRTEQRFALDGSGRRCWHRRGGSRRADQPAGQRRGPGRGAQRGRLRAGRAAGPVRDVHHRAAAGPAAADRQRPGRPRGHLEHATTATLFVSLWDLGPTSSGHRTAGPRPGRAPRCSRSWPWRRSS